MSSLLPHSFETGSLPSPGLDLFFWLVWQPAMLRDPPGSTTHSSGVTDVLETKPACSVRSASALNHDPISLSPVSGIVLLNKLRNYLLG